MDDFHNINAIKTPLERILTNAVHMATLLLEVQSSVDAVPVDPTNIHRCVMVTIPGRALQLCRGVNGRYQNVISPVPKDEETSLKRATSGKPVFEFKILIKVSLKRESVCELFLE
ncbi:uncharacterized protein LOC122947939 [Acropora millepora]|uniref:uncharacterized protein LOC122947939 n=1 Tax=Acropora millepora TaxID=45264 RepID=UPI001CF5A73D|nr:uncharacterized protein LOC122947939 [Acropora millepora]